MNSFNSSSDRLLHTLQQIASSSVPLAARDLSVALDFPQSTLYRHLHCLTHWGLVQPVGNSGRYSAGPMGLQLAMSFQQHDTLAVQALPELQRLARSSNETAALMVATGQQVICIAMIESQQALRCSFSPSKRSLRLMRWCLQLSNPPCRPACRQYACRAMPSAIVRLIRVSGASVLQFLSPEKNCSAR